MPAVDAYVPEHRTGRNTMLALIIIILCAGLIYAVVAIDTAGELRTRNALQQNSVAAQLSARLLDEQWEDLRVATQELIQRSSVDSDLRSHNTPRLTTEVKYAVDLVPALLLAAVYDMKGRRIACYPSSPVAPDVATGTDWYEGVKVSRDLYQSDSMRIRLMSQPLTEVIAIAAPIGSKSAPTGYLMALYRVGDVDSWLRDLGLKGSDLYIVNARGLVVDASTGADRSMKFTPFTSFQLAIHHGAGSVVSHHFYAAEDADVGYAYALKPGWAVIVARPVSQALAPTRSLVGRLTLLGALVLALLITGALLILKLYRTQDRMANELSSQNAQLREADRVKSDFLANVSHDLRTPLATMQISISGLLEPGLNWRYDEVKDALRAASEGLDQVSARVRNLLEMARLEAHIWPLNKQVSDLTDVVGSALERMKPLLQGRELKLEFPTGPLLVECDPNQIETVVVNLLENASKYSPAGTPIGITGAEHAGLLRLHVQDCGPGIPEEDLENVFVKFYRSNRQKHVGGTGLGLAICKSLIEGHGGHIGAENTLKDGKVVGARFWFTLPGLTEEHRKAYE